MVNGEVKIPDINRAVTKWDVEEYLANNRRKKREAEKQKRDESPNQQSTWKGSAPRGPPKTGPKQATNQGPSDQAAGERQGQQAQGPSPGPTGPKKSTYVPTEEHAKLTKDQKDALRVAREMRATGGPKK